MPPNHSARKPNSGMIKRAALDLNIDLSSSILIGDKASDMEAARHAGVTGHLFASGDLADFLANILRFRDVRC